MLGTEHSAARSISDEIVITRLLDAPRQLVFDAWSHPEHLMRWFAPRDCSAPYCTVDFRVGGRFHFCMRFHGGPEIWGLGVYQEIVVPERIIYLDRFADAQGNPVPPSYYGMSAAHPPETLVSVTFAEEGGQTRVTLRHAMPASVPEHGDMRRGWLEMFDRLVALARG